MGEISRCDACFDKYSWTVNGTYVAQTCYVFRLFHEAVIRHRQYIQLPYDGFVGKQNRIARFVSIKIASEIIVVFNVPSHCLS